MGRITRLKSLEIARTPSPTTRLCSRLPIPISRPGTSARDEPGWQDSNLLDRLLTSKSTSNSLENFDSFRSSFGSVPLQLGNDTSTLFCFNYTRLVLTLLSFCRTRPSLPQISALIYLTPSSTNSSPFLQATLLICQTTSSSSDNKNYERLLRGEFRRWRKRPQL